jgi:hypothetical protein
MMKKYGATPEEFARWEEERRELEKYIARRRAELEEREQREERRRHRLQRLTFGLLGR